MGCGRAFLVGLRGDQPAGFDRIWQRCLGERGLDYPLGEPAAWSVRGSWAIGSTYPDFTAAGQVYVSNVYGINNIGVIASPAVPATTVGYKNNYGIDMRIVMVAGGGNITAVDVKSFSGGYAGTGLAGANCSYVLRANETIKVTYPGTLTWSWATL